MSENFSERLRAARELRGFSQGDLAERAGFQPSAISHFETGRRAPSFDNLKRLADALNVTTDYLLDRSEHPTLSGPVAGTVFRHAEKLSDEDLRRLQDIIETFAKRSEEDRAHGVGR